MAGRAPLARTGADVVRGLSALVALVALVVGVPLGLVRFVGWPLPTVLPSADAISDAVTRVGVSDATVVKIVACVLWLAWAQLAISVGAEIVAVGRRRRAPAVPAVGAIRHLAASLVAGVVLLASSPAVVGAVAPFPAAAAAAPVRAVPFVFEAAPADTAPAPAAPTWTVRPRDTLWGIAEATLGRGERWAEIRRANVGREVGPGVTFTERTEVLQPGWTLVLPVDATGGPSGRTVVVAAGDSLSTIAARQLGDADRWPELWRANEGRRFGERTFRDPNLILPGWELEVPAPSVEAAPAAPTDPPPAAAPAPEPVSAPVVTSAPDPTPAAVPPVPLPPDGAEDVAAPAPAGSEASDVRPGWVLPAGIGGATLLATGIAGLVASRRRRRLRSTGPHHVFAPPDPALVPIEAAVRLGDDPVGMARVDVALRALTARLVPSADGPAPRVHVMVRRADGDIEVELDRPAEAVPLPWCRTRRAERLLLPAATELEALVDDALELAAPCPAMVLIGASDDAEVYVDVEALGVVVLDGPPDEVTALARAMAATLAVSPLADLVHLVTSGVDCAGVTDEERVHAVSDPDAALDLTASLSAGVRHALDGRATSEVRRDEPEEPWEPVITILVRAELTPAQLTEVRQLVAGGGVAVVTDVDVPGARYRLRAGVDGTWQLEPTGLAVTPRGLAADELRGIGGLLAHAGAEAVDVTRPDLPRTDAPFVEPDWSIVVRLLGPVEVHNRAGDVAPFERAKAMELVAWLAQHRAHPTRGAARAALWETGGRAVTFANIVSDARRALAAIADVPDGDWIGRSAGDLLPLDPLVVTDADLLGARLEHARRQGDADAVATLRPGLDGVCDAPYAGTNWLWPDGEALPSNLTLVVTNAATEMAERCLALGDVDGVFWATARGFRVLPGHDALVGLRMQAHAAAGNLAGVRYEFESYERAINADPWSDGEPSAAVVAVRNRLLAPSRTAVPG